MLLFFTQCTVNIVFDRVGKVDPVTRGLQIAVNYMGLNVDVKFWSQHISFILVGIIVITSIRGLLITLTKVSERRRRPKSVSPSASSVVDFEPPSADELNVSNFRFFNNLEMPVFKELLYVFFGNGNAAGLFFSKRTNRGRETCETFLFLLISGLFVFSRFPFPVLLRNIEFKVLQHNRFSARSDHGYVLRLLRGVDADEYAARIPDHHYTSVGRPAVQFLPSLVRRDLFSERPVEHRLPVSSPQTSQHQPARELKEALPELIVHLILSTHFVCLSLYLFSFSVK